MTLTRKYNQTVIARIKRDPKFARALSEESVKALCEGEIAEGLSMLRDINQHRQMPINTDQESQRYLSTKRGTIGC